MSKVLVVSRRGRLVPGLVGALAEGKLDFETLAEATAALARLLAQRFDLLVIDGAGLSGADRALLPALRASSGTATRLLVITRAGRGGALRRLLRLRPDALLLDPIDLEEAGEVVARLLSTPPSSPPPTDVVEELSTFLKGLAHEILNPLTPILAFLQILQRDTTLSPELRGRYQAMWDSTKRIEKTVRDLEAFARTRRPQRAPLDLALFLDELTSQWRSRQPPLRAVVHAQGGTPPVLADRTLLREALHRLTLFAAGGEAKGPRPENGSSAADAVEFTLKSGAGRVHLDIRGRAPVRLPPRPRDALLPYLDAQGDGRPGTLDLAAAWGILHGHHAQLDVAPAEPDGVRFQLSFPVAPHAGP